VTRPIVFATDYSLEDEFVGVCHGVMARIALNARVIDLTHSIRRHNVFDGAFTLRRASRYMPEDAVWLAVVDPEVGSTRRSIAARSASGAMMVGPDNGLLSMLWGSLGGVEAAVEIRAEDVLIQPVSHTFHGRDVFAPAAARLAMGKPLEELGPAIDPASLVALRVPVPKVDRRHIECTVTDVDSFGNVELNIHPGDLEAAGLFERFRIGDVSVRRVTTFANGSTAECVAIEDSQGLVALVVNRGSAASLIRVREGDTLILS